MPETDARRTATPVMILTCAVSPPGRLASARREAERLVPPERIVVVDGMVATAPDLREHFDARRARVESKWMPTPGEIAVYETHRRAWRALLDGPWSEALVVEDDFRVVHPALVGACLANAAALLGDGRDIVKLFDFPRAGSGNRAIVADVAGIPVVKWRHPRAGMVAYLISRAGAGKFLARDKFFRVVDEDTKLSWELGLDIWSLPVNAIVDASPELGGSIIDEDRRNVRRRTLLKSMHGTVIGLRRRLANARFFGMDVRAARRRGLRYEVVTADTAGAWQVAGDRAGPGSAALGS